MTKILIGEIVAIWVMLASRYPVQIRAQDCVPERLKGAPDSRTHFQTFTSPSITQCYRSDWPACSDADSCSGLRRMRLGLGTAVRRFTLPS